MPKLRLQTQLGKVSTYTATYLPVAGEDQGKLTGEQEKYFRILRTRFFDQYVQVVTGW